MLRFRQEQRVLIQFLLIFSCTYLPKTARLICRLVFITYDVEMSSGAAMFDHSYVVQSVKTFSADLNPWLAALLVIAGLTLIAGLISSVFVSKLLK
jgi:hypothetical protein